MACALAFYGVPSPSANDSALWVLGNISPPKRTQRRCQHRLTTRDSGCIGFVILCSQHTPTDVSDSLADSRGNMHLTRHHPIHAQNFTIKTHSTAKYHVLCFASTCSDASFPPPCVGIFVITISEFQSHLWCPTYQFARESLFPKEARLVNATPPFCV